MLKVVLFFMQSQDRRKGVEPSWHESYDGLLNKRNPTNIYVLAIGYTEYKIFSSSSKCPQSIHEIVDFFNEIWNKRSINI